MDTTGAEHPRPLLTRHAVERVQSNDIPGHYDNGRDVWIVEGTAGPVPIVSAAAAAPFTKVQGERDPSLALLELATKTHAQMERDDLSYAEACAELVTKTMTTQERDDAASSSGFLLELATKTDTQRERDDR